MGAPRQSLERVVPYDRIARPYSRSLEPCMDRMVGSRARSYRAAVDLAESTALRKTELAQ